MGVIKLAVYGYAPATTMLKRGNDFFGLVTLTLRVSLS